MFHTKVVEKIKTHILFSNFFWKSCHLWDSGEKYCRPRHATDDNIIRLMHTVCWITKATYTLRMKYLLLFHDNSG